MASQFPTLIITTSVDWKSDGLDVGSNTDELDWKDWKRPVISLLKAKLFRNRTSTEHYLSGNDQIAMLVSHKIRNGCIEENKKRVLLSRALETVYACCLSIIGLRQSDFDKGANSPSKSRATISASSVGETDIHTPSKFG
jgi:hypothetical protein